MGQIAAPLHEVLSGLSSSLRSVDLRVAAYRGPIGQPPVEDWHPLRSAIRISFKPPDVAQAEYMALKDNLGPNAAAHFAILHDTIAFPDLPRIPPMHGLVVRTAGGQLRPEAVHLERSLMGRVDRYRHHSASGRREERPAIEYFWTPSNQAARLFIDRARLEVETRRELGMDSELLMTSHLGFPDPSSDVGAVYIVVEPPAMITGVRWHASVIHFEVTADSTLGDVRLFASRFRSDGRGVIRHSEVALSGDPAPGSRVLRGEANLGELDQDDHIQCVLTHPHVPELDELTRRGRDLLPLVERNPLLVCLRRFWDLEPLYRRIERPYLTAKRRLEITPQDAFQSDVATFLTLAGFQTLDLGREEHIRAPGSRVEIATADLLAYHARHRLLLIGACTINVPKGEDYERLLHVTGILAEEFPDMSRIIVIPVMFTGQEPNSVLSEQAASRRLRLLTRREMLRLRSIIESGEEDRFIYFLTGSNYDL